MDTTFLRSRSPDLPPKERRHWAAIEKAVASFDATADWPDYIAFLLRLQKALALSELPPHSVSWLPLADHVLAKLALCLLPRLPSGVHQKTLAVYELIFTKLTPQCLDTNARVWLPGLLPVVAYATTQVRPHVVSIFRTHVLALSPGTLAQLAAPVVLALAGGLDDDAAETYKDVEALLDEYRGNLADDTRFWLALFLCVVRCPDRRMGALNWCMLKSGLERRDGSGEKFAEKGGNEPKTATEEPETIESTDPGSLSNTGSDLPAKPTPDLSSHAGTDKSDLLNFAGAAASAAALPTGLGLMVRAFTAALDTATSFNPATDVIVIRGFFDLLLAHVPLLSPEIAALSPADKEMLVMAACGVTRRRDMSLNRRLWAWLLGPEADDLRTARAAYFEQYAVPVVEKGLMRQISEGTTQQQTAALRTALLLVMDRWEINQVLTPRMLEPVVDAAHRAFTSHTTGWEDVLAGARAFFDEVEAVHIWRYMAALLANTHLDMLTFVVRHFRFPDEDRSVHVPLAVACLLASRTADDVSVGMLEALVDMCPPGMLAAVDDTVDEAVVACVDRPGEGSSSNQATIVSSITSYYDLLATDEAGAPPYNAPTVSCLILTLLTTWYVSSIHSTSSRRLAKLLAELVYSVPNNSSRPDRLLLDTILAWPPYTWNGAAPDMSTVFGMVMLCRHLIKGTSRTEKAALLKIVLSNLWYPLATADPANYQVEAVRNIFDLELCFDVHQIEAGILHMLLHTPGDVRVKAFYKLWVHSADSSGAEAILSNPLHVILDDITDKANAMAVDKFVHNAITDGSAARLLKLITDPLLGATFMKAQKTEINAHDDLALFAYNLQTVLNVMRSNEKLLKDCFNHEFVVAESSEKLDLINSNHWDISNYKSLVVNIVEKFFSLLVSRGLLDDKAALSSFLDCTTAALDLYSLLITGTETEFDRYFHFLINRCLYFIHDLTDIPYEIELAQAKYIKCILHFLHTAKSMSINLNLLHNDESSKDPLLVSFLIQGITKCQSSTLLEKWFSLLTAALYQFNESVFSVILTLNDAIIDKVKGYMNFVRSFKAANDSTDLEASLSILLAGIEDLLSISHSYLVTSNLRAHARTQAANGDTGFLDVFLGVFLIESPSVRTEEQNKLFSILLAFQDASRVAFDIWNWADSKPQPSSDCLCASEKSITYLANKLKFRSRKLLESLSELERQEVIETIIESTSPTATKVKILHVLDSGRSQVTLPHIFNSIITRCHPQALNEKQLSSKNSMVTEAQLSRFLVSYFESIDYDALDDIWEISMLFFKEVLSHPLYYRSLLVCYLNMMKALSLKSASKKGGDGRRNSKELANSFLGILNAATNSKNSDSEGSVASSAESSEYPVADISELVEHFGEILQDTDKTNTAVTTIITSMILPNVKPKSAVTEETVLKLTCTIGKWYPNRAWKQLVLDVFMDNGFFTSRKFEQQGWKEAIALWIGTDREKLTDFIARVTPSAQASAANIFIWNEHSEVEDRIFILRRISYLILVEPADLFGNVLDELFVRLGAALNSSCPPLYKSEVFNLFRVITLRFSEVQLLPYWLFIIQNLLEAFMNTLTKLSKDANSLTKDELKLTLAGCKLLDQLLLVGFDEFNLGEWLFVATSPGANSVAGSSSLIDQLAVHTEVILTKEDPIGVVHPAGSATVQPLLCGVRQINHIANLKKFFGLLSYINYERTYGLCGADITACNDDAFGDLYVG